MKKLHVSTAKLQLEKMLNRSPAIAVFWLSTTNVQN